MKEYTLSFCKLIKHNESLLEVIIDKGTDLSTKHANEANNILNHIFKEPYGVLVDLRNDFSVTYEGGVTIGNSELEKRVAFLIHRERTETAARSIVYMQKTGFPKKELMIFDNRTLAIKWLEGIITPDHKKPVREEKMSTLIEDFKKEHSKIFEAIKEFKKIGILTKEGHAKLMSMILDLLSHLWNEDERLYPVLRKAAVHNKKLKEILSLFKNGLENVYEEAINFLAKHSKGIIDSSFQKEYERLFDVLSKRIEYEENILFGEYEKTNK